MSARDLDIDVSKVLTVMIPPVLGLERRQWQQKPKIDNTTKHAEQTTTPHRSPRLSYTLCPPKPGNRRRRHGESVTRGPVTPSQGTEPSGATWRQVMRIILTYGSTGHGFYARPGSPLGFSTAGLALHELRRSVRVTGEGTTVLTASFGQGLPIEPVVSSWDRRRQASSDEAAMWSGEPRRVYP